MVQSTLSVSPQKGLLNFEKNSKWSFRSQFLRSINCFTMIFGWLFSNPKLVLLIEKCGNWYYFFIFLIILWFAQLHRTDERLIAGSGTYKMKSDASIPPTIGVKYKRRKSLRLNMDELKISVAKCAVSQWTNKTWTLNWKSTKSKGSTNDNNISPYTQILYQIVFTTKGHEATMIGIWWKIFVLKRLNHFAVRLDNAVSTPNSIQGYSSWTTSWLYDFI